MDETTVGDVAALLVIVVPLLVAMAATVADRARSFSQGTTDGPAGREKPDPPDCGTTSIESDSSAPARP